MMKRYYYKKGLALALSALLVAEPVSGITSSMKVHAQEVIAVEGTGAAEENNIELSEENFPDKNFREYLKSEFDEDGDGWIDKMAVTTLKIQL